MRGRLPTGPTWFETSDLGIVNDLSFSPQNTRTAIANATQGLGSVPWIDGTDRQMATRVCQATPQLHYIGDVRDLLPHTVQQVSNEMMTPSSILPRDLPVPVPLQKTSYAICDAGPTCSSITMGAPVSLRPGSERYDARMASAVDLTTGPTRPLPQEYTEQVHARSRVAAIEERGGLVSPDAGSTSWFFRLARLLGKATVHSPPKVKAQVLTLTSQTTIRRRDIVLLLQ
jgi:hypothetical protein